MKQPAQGCHWFGGGRVGSLIAAIISDKNPIYVDKVRPDFRQILEIHKIFQIDNPSSSNLGDYRGQHLDLAERQIATECGRTNVTIDESESPLAWLARRRGRNSRALIGAHQFLAGERLRADFTRAHMMPCTTSNWAVRFRPVAALQAASARRPSPRRCWQRASAYARRSMWPGRNSAGY